MNKKDITLEVQSMLQSPIRLGGGWQVAKSIVDLASAPAGTFKRIGPNGAEGKRNMSQAEAARIVAEAKLRIEMADEGEATRDARRAFHYRTFEPSRGTACGLTQLIGRVRYTGEWADVSCEKCLAKKPVARAPRSMSKLTAKKIAAAILSLEQFNTLVDNQFDANGFLAKLVRTKEERQMVLDAAEEFEQQMHDLAGDEILRIIVGTDGDS